MACKKESEREREGREEEGREEEREEAYNEIVFGCARARVARIALDPLGPSLFALSLLHAHSPLAACLLACSLRSFWLLVRPSREGRHTGESLAKLGVGRTKELSKGGKIRSFVRSLTNRTFSPPCLGLALSQANSGRRS